MWCLYPRKCPTHRVILILVLIFRKSRTAISYGKFTLTEKRKDEDKSRQFIQPFPYNDVIISYICHRNRLPNPLFHIIHSIQLLFIYYPMGYTCLSDLDSRFLTFPSICAWAFTSPVCFFIISFYIFFFLLFYIIWG